MFRVRHSFHHISIDVTRMTLKRAGIEMIKSKHANSSVWAIVMTSTLEAPMYTDKIEVCVGVLAYVCETESE